MSQQTLHPYNRVGSFSMLWYNTLNSCVTYRPLQYRGGFVIIKASKVLHLTHRITEIMTDDEVRSVSQVSLDDVCEILRFFV